MTKVEAIIKVLEDNNGVATWEIIYNQIEKYYPLAKVSNEWQAGIRGVLYREIKKNKFFKLIGNGVISLFNYNIQNLVLQDDIVPETVRSVEMSIRIGQERFRNSLLKKLKFCPITNINDKRILNASHIKPWAVSTDTERLDTNNGFLFSPTFDKLFDRGMITFENNKKIVISKSLSKSNILNLGIEYGKVYTKLPIEDRLEYLKFHRETIFIE